MQVSFDKTKKHKNTFWNPSNTFWKCMYFFPWIFWRPFFYNYTGESFIQILYTYIFQIQVSVTCTSQIWSLYISTWVVYFITEAWNILAQMCTGATFTFLHISYFRNSPCKPLFKHLEFVCFAYAIKFHPHLLATSKPRARERPKCCYCLKPADPDIPFLVKTNALALLWLLAAPSKIQPILPDETMLL